MQTTLEHGGQLLIISLPSDDSYGRGASATVLRGTAVTGAGIEYLALKVYPSLISPTEKELLHREIDVWRNINHERILRFFGQCTLGSNQVALVSPFMKNGNMCQYLKLNPARDRLKLLIQVAEGLQYLHDDAGVVHGDIKGENVLICDQGNALLADFGLSTLVDATDNPTATHIRQRMTLRFSAPELLMDDASHESPSDDEMRILRSKTTYSDIFAFGMLIYQIYTDKPPWPGARDLQVVSAIVKGELPPRPMSGVTGRRFCDPTWAFCEQCWAMDPAIRPTIIESLETLQKLGKTNLNPFAPAFQMDMGRFRTPIRIQPAIVVLPSLNPQAAAFTPRPTGHTIIPTQLKRAQTSPSLNATAAVFAPRAIPISPPALHVPSKAALDPHAAPFTPRASPVSTHDSDGDRPSVTSTQPANRPQFQMNGGAAVFVPRGGPAASTCLPPTRPQLNISAPIFVPRRPPPLTLPPTIECDTPAATPELVEDGPSTGSTPPTPSTGPTTPSPSRTSSESEASMFNIDAKPSVPQHAIPHEHWHRASHNDSDESDRMATMRAIAYALIF